MEPESTPPQPAFRIPKWVAAVVVVVLIAGIGIATRSGHSNSTNLCQAGAYLGASYPSKPSQSQLKADFVSSFGSLDGCSTMSYSWKDSGGTTHDGTFKAKS